MSPPNISLILIMVCFWITFWLVQKFLIGPLGATLSERNRRIDSAESAWRSKQEEFASQTARLEGEMEEALREAAQIRTGHRQRALEEREERLRHAREKANGRLQEALDLLDKDVEGARAELKVNADELARLFASRLLGRKVAS